MSKNSFLAQLAAQFDQFSQSPLVDEAAPEVALATENPQDYLHDFLRHIAEQSAPEFPLATQATFDYHLPLDPFSRDDLAKFIKSSLSAMILFPASVASAIIPEKGFSGLASSAARNPAMMMKGFPLLIPYSYLAVDNAIKFGKKMGGEEAEFYKKAQGALAAACFEATVGAGFDIGSLQTSFRTLRAQHEIAKDPKILRDLFSLEELRKLPGCEHLDQEQIMEQPHKNFPLTKEQLAKVAQKVESVNISAEKFGRMVVAATPASIVRNACFYMLYFNSANKEDVGMMQHAAASLAMALVSSIPKAWVSEAAANSFVRDQGIFDSIKNGAVSSFSRAVKNPKVFGQLVAVRAMAMALNTLCFSDKNFEEIKNNLTSLFPDLKDVQLDEKEEKQLSDMIAAQMPDEKTSKQIRDLVAMSGLRENPEEFFRDMEAAKKPAVEISLKAAQPAVETTDKTRHY